ncbi:MAG: signal peptidase I [Candidatus Izemoplasmatales bacterium]
MKIVKKIANVFFYALVILLVYYLFLEIVMPRKTIDYIGFKTFVVLTPSMEPEINVNDMIIVKKTKQENIEVGDTITFEVYIQDLGKEVFVTHYVADIDQSGDEVIYYTQGANAEDGEYDDWVDEDNQEINITYDDIAGEYVFKVPNLGLLSRMFQDPYMLGFIVLDVIIIYFLIKVIIKKKDDPKEKG